MKRSKAPALLRAAGCPGEPPGTDPCRAQSLARCGESSGAAQHASGLRVVPGKHWGSGPWFPACTPAVATASSFS